MIGMLAALLLGAASPVSPLPALLMPRVRSSKQLHYRTTWTRRLSQPFVATASPLHVAVSYTVTVDSVSPSGVLWTRRYDGAPGSTLRLAIDSSGAVVDRDSGQPAGLPVFLYS